jgi:anti-anti-sigma regulatory factor
VSSLNSGGTSNTSDDGPVKSVVVHEPHTSSKPVRGSVISFGRASLTAFESSWVTVIALSGEIDALNAARVATCLHGFVSHDRALVLDCSNLDFLGVELLPGLLELDDSCDRLGVDWAMVTNHPTRRLLRVADPGRQLPAVGSMVEVLQRFRTARRRLAQLHVVE